MSEYEVVIYPNDEHTFRVAPTRSSVRSSWPGSEPGSYSVSLMREL